MLTLALKMLIGNRAACMGVIFGIFLATLLIAQQSAIFLGLISRSYRSITDIPAPTVWVMDPATENDSKIRDMPGSALDIVRSISNVEWAVPINVMPLPLTTSTGAFQVAMMYGIDDATLIGAPEHILQGTSKDLRRDGGIIVDVYSANGVLAGKGPDGTKNPLKVGDSLEINGHRAVVVGISKITQGFYPEPIIFTSIHSLKAFSSSHGDRLSFVAAKTAPSADIELIQRQINSYPGLTALTKDEFESRIVTSFLKTGILINFGLSVGLGFIIGFSIAGQIFYIMTLQNLMYYALIKALGGTQRMILHMIIFQAALVGIIGFLLGIGATILWGIAIKNTTLAFLFPWQLLLFTGIIVVIICVLTAILSIRRVFRVEPKILMGT